MENTVTRSTRAVSLTEGAPQGISTFKTLAERYEFVIAKAAQGSNYFTGYIDSNGPYGLSYGFADWVKPGQVYVKDLHGLIH